MKKSRTKKSWNDKTKNAAPASKMRLRLRRLALHFFFPLLVFVAFFTYVLSFLMARQRRLIACTFENSSFSHLPYSMDGRSHWTRI